MITIYAEKPDMGKKIAAVLNESSTPPHRNDGFIEITYKGAPAFVTWGYGHLCELKSAKDYDESYKQWRNIPIPFIPHPYEVKVKDDVVKQFRIVKGLFDKSSLIINATDDDNEGEIIFAYLMEAARCKKPFKRAHFTSQTKEGITDAFDHLKSAEEVKNRTDAGRSRSIADWVVGCNLTVAMSLKYSGNSVLSLGRVQTPTLNILVEKELAIRDFKPEPYYVIKAVFETDKHEKYEAESLRKRIFDKSEAEIAYKSLAGKKGIVQSVDHKEKYKEAPPLYNLLALQMDANSKFGFTLAQTLEIAQSLYEAGFTTYPRSDSQFLTEDMEPVVNNVLDVLAKSSSEYAALINGQPRKIKREKYFDNSKVSSHYAIIPTTSEPRSLTPQQQKIYDLIARSVIMMIHPPAKLKKTTVVTAVGEERFSSTGNIVVSPGWMAVDTKPDDKLLPDLKVNEVVSGEYSLQEKVTEAPKRYTDRSLASAMEGAGKELDDAELRKAMAEGKKGLGTEATRASIVETLIARSYAVREKSIIKPTEKGISLIQTLPLKEIKSAELTAQWEQRLDNISKGKERMDDFIADIENATKTWCSDIYAASDNNSLASTSANTTGLTCPGCGNPIIKQKWGYGCSNYKNGCKFAISDTIASKKLTDSQIERLIKNGTTGNKPVAGFVSKSGKKFEAILNLEVEKNNGLVTECKTSFVFPSSTPAQPSSPVSSDLLCPSCRSPLTNGKWGWECSEHCGFSFGYTIASRKMKEEDLRELIKTGRTKTLTGFVGKTGKPFSALLKLKKDKKGTEFVFPNKT